MNLSSDLTLDLPRLRQGYASGEFTPLDLVELIAERMKHADSRIWIRALTCDEMKSYAQKLLDRSPSELPLYGVPFAIKDNIDLAEVPTTCACPDFAFTPARSAHVVERLIAVGAIPIGKTNLDQFATGLVGTRSPYGTPPNAYDERYVPGGSSSGSAVAVAKGLASFSLGTDTAGSGRIPAAFNNLIGVKPTRGVISTRGVFPACRTLDCVSIFALNTPDARDVLEVAVNYDAEDDYARLWQEPFGKIAQPVRLGVPSERDLEFFGDAEYRRLFSSALDRLRACGCSIEEIDFSPFLAAAKLLYGGPWVAERYAAIRAFIEEKPDSLHPITRQIIAGSRNQSAADAFSAFYQLAGLAAKIKPLWEKIDAIVTPTAGTIFTLAQLEAEPIARNTDLGRYTNFMNLLDLSALALPAGFRADGLPFGITLSAPAFHDAQLLALGRVFENQAAASLPTCLLVEDAIDLVVCGAHMTGLALNSQLTSLGAQFKTATRTAPCYRFYKLAGKPPYRPGLVRVEPGQGNAIEVEVWRVPSKRMGEFLVKIPSPLGLGRVLLEDGSQVTGFLCESRAIDEDGVVDITHLAAWRKWLQTVT